MKYEDMDLVAIETQARALRAKAVAEVFAALKSAIAKLVFLGAASSHKAA